VILKTNVRKKYFLLVILLISVLYAELKFFPTVTQRFKSGEIELWKYKVYGAYITSVIYFIIGILISNLRICGLRKKSKSLILLIVGLVLFIGFIIFEMIYLYASITRAIEGFVGFRDYMHVLADNGLDFFSYRWVNVVFGGMVGLKNDVGFD